MGDNERARGGFRRRKFYVNKEKDKDRIMRGDRRKDIKIYKEEEKEMKTPTILTKPKPEPEKSEPPIQPTILLKPRDTENRNASPNQASHSVPKPPEKAAASNYQIASKTPAIPDAKTIACTEMRNSVPFLGSRGDELVEMLSDQSEFLVVTAIGAPGTGKTTTLARLVRPSPSGKNVFEKSDGQGLHAFMTSSRVLLLDSPPITTSILDWVGKETRAQELFDSESDRLSFHYTAFLLSVCHVVIVVLGNDTKQNENVIKFLLAVEKVKPVTTTQGTEPDEIVEYWPQVVILHNRSKSDNYTPKGVNYLQEYYKNLFEKSKLQIETGLGVATGFVLPIIKPEFCTIDPINLFLLPEIETKAQLKSLDKFRGHLGYKDLMCKFKVQIFSAEPIPVGHGVYTEKNWYQYAAKTWEKLWKGSKYPDFARLLIYLEHVGKEHPKYSH